MAATLDCGQAFRWKTYDNGISYVGVVDGAIYKVMYIDNNLVVESDSKLDVDFLINYFSLDIDYLQLQEELKKNPTLRKCVEHAPGIRVLRQSFDEVLISFVISQNNNISRIKGIIERLCEMCGEKIGKAPDGSHLYSFPSPKAIVNCGEENLSYLRAGYRVPGILDASNKLASKEVSAEMFDGIDDEQVQKILLRIYGVGPKVADCVALFGLGRFSFFPKDVWIKRAMEKLFPRGLPQKYSSIAGIAQQYIFDYARAEL